MDKINEHIIVDQFSKLIALGNYESNVYYIIIFIAIAMIYLFIHPLITWFIALQSTRLLSYILCSLIILLSILVIALSLENMQSLLLQTIKIACQCLAVFGVALIIHHGFHTMKRKI